MVHYVSSEGGLTSYPYATEILLRVKPLYCESITKEDVAIIMLVAVPEHFVQESLYIGEACA
jgi:hypothetical protein